MRTCIFQHKFLLAFFKNITRNLFSLTHTQTSPSLSIVSKTMSYDRLKSAVGSGDLDRVRQLVEVDGYDPMSHGSVRHETSLHLAARYVG